MRPLLFFLLLLATYGRAAVLPPGFVEVPLATGLNPTAMAQSSDGRIWITEKHGAVRIVENGELLPDPFLTLEVDNNNERGLSGIAFDPQFEQNGYVYLYYTVKFTGRNRVVRVTAIGNFALPGSEYTVLELDFMPGTIHNGGAMVFGTDGKLYVAVGDGADGPKAASNESLLGKILRLNADGSIPGDNPYFNQNQGVFRAIYASGLRNPFTMAVQRGTGRIFVGDVGSDLHEEINEILPGAFYGWNQLEGKRVNQNLPANYRDPLYSYPHTLGCAVVGGAFYNPPNGNFPASYTGKYFFADYCFNYIKTLDPATGQVAVFASDIDRPLCLLTGINGSLYYISRGGMGGGSVADNTGTNEGMLWRIEYVGNGAPVFSVHPSSQLYTSGETATFTAQANGTQPIVYQWQRDSVDIPGASGQTLVLPGVTVADSGVHIRCLAVNGFGQITSQQATLRVTNNQRPVPTILSPAPDFLYSAGDTIFFSGAATDPETGALTPDDLTWRIDLHHNTHNHPGMPSTPGIDQGFFVLPTVGETDPNVWLRIHLSASDPAGLSSKTQLDLYPYKTNLRVETDPPGLPLRLNGHAVTAPAEAQSVRGLRHQAEAGLSYWQDNRLLTFDGWDNASGQTLQSTGLLHAFFANDDTTVRKAVYASYPAGEGVGLYGTYHYLNTDLSFGGQYYGRVDTTVDFNWMQDSPGAPVPANNFGIRWQGVLEAPVTGGYQLILNTDDGCRLWLNDSLMLDVWEGQEAIDHAATVYLYAGVPYRIRIEYFELGGMASAQLLWSSERIGRSVIPKSQLYPVLPEFQNGVKTTLTARIQPNPVQGNTLGLYLEANQQETLNIKLVSAGGRVLHNWVNIALEMPNALLELPVGNLATGTYWLEVTGKNAERQVLGFVKMP